jgi:hypothetical protein
MFLWFLLLPTNHSSLLQYKLFVIHTASLDRCQRQRDTLRQNAETISEGPLSNSLLWDLYLKNLPPLKWEVHLWSNLYFSLILSEFMLKKILVIKNTPHISTLPLHVFCCESIVLLSIYSTLKLFRLRSVKCIHTL